jgi:hypothetical protein
VNYYFIGLLIACWIYALIAGGAPERIGSTAYALSVEATHLVLSTHSRWMRVESGEFIVDAAVFIIFVLVALRANRFWPIWVSALLGLGVLAHVARLAGPDVVWYAYVVVLTIWSYPIVAIIAVGTFNHQRRMRRLGEDRSWSSFSGRSASSPPAPPRNG